jgi:hypothetical protein
MSARRQHDLLAKKACFGVAELRLGTHLSNFQAIGSMRKTLILTVWICAFLPAMAAKAEVVIAVGPTNIPRGDAVGARDITVSTDLFAIAFAVDTAPPWGVARGGIVDIAPVRDGEPGYDIASLADFMPNNWSSWPTTYQRVTIENAGPHEVTVRTARDWGEVELETTFHVRDGDSKIHIVTRMTNKGEASLDGLLSGYVVWPDGGYLIGDPVVTVNDDVHSPGGWTAAYDADWLLGLHAPFSDRAVRRGRDRYSLHDLEPGESMTFEAWLQIENDGALTPMVQTEIDFAALPSGRVSGRVISNDGEPVARPAVVISKNGSAFAWATGKDGRYDMTLPPGSYELYATAGGYARGKAKEVTVSKNSALQIDFDDVRPAGTVNIHVADGRTRQALDARITVKDGYKPLIGYLGKSTYFTELNPVGEFSASIAPGKYVLEVAAGGGFLSVPQMIEVLVESGQVHKLKADIAVTAMPNERGWYSADLHHHSDVLDGFTEAEFVLRSELAAGVDVAFLSDHDSVLNNGKMQVLADARDMPFIPATELSPSWGHFNAYPIDAGRTVDIDTGQATVQDIFAAARHVGADVIAVNHPYSDYGYFENHEKNAVPGGFDSGFDLVEIQPLGDNKGELSRNRETLEKAWEMWNGGQKAYLAAGSDVHDVWSFESARARTFVRVDGELSIDKFIAGLKAGHAYASQGPLVYPEILFGSEIIHSAGAELALKYTVQAVSGLRSVQLIERGNDVQLLAFDGVGHPVPVEFSVAPDTDTWFSLVIEDANGRSAYTNPVWINVEP